MAGLKQHRPGTAAARPHLGAAAGTFSSDAAPSMRPAADLAEFVPMYPPSVSTTNDRAPRGPALPTTPWHRNRPQIVGLRQELGVCHTGARAVTTEPFAS
ncbi:hypothetical protein GCM10017771_86470 [Streptomyces capitiformicae]|uniref:Uncharacterized protein n=1 Tax=Streptomyces capitiformicae TaxID=2014920 RepID=A0A919DPD7_9ACTN|nr:hypothetical protein GCM10017771_86470 [Streptomyces capitiformicae]